VKPLSVLLVLAALFAPGARAPAPLRVETLVSGLDTPWDLAWGPDGALWVTERGGTISRVDPSTGRLTRVGRIDVVEAGESGLMGMAFHPDFDTSPYVYFAHSYRRLSRIRNRLVRMRFEDGRLGTPEVLLDGIPGNRNHNGSRLAVGPDGYLYMTTGDAGQGDLAQDLGSLAGKVLRLTLEGRPAPGNPDDSFVYSYGHRNPQGIVFHPATGALYVAEHGPRDNDEVNRVRIGGNYGWPDVHGFCDGETSREEAFCRSHDVQAPIRAWTPTVALSGLAFYDAELIPGWNGSLLVTSLRGATLFRLKLSADGREVVERELLFEREYGRLRDVLVGPRGEVYLATSNRDGRGRPAEEDDRILRIAP
jgi:glucose/arabinose dehydrogenase